MPENKKTISYKDAGVNIDKGNESVDLIKPLVKSTFRPEVITELGGFGGLFSLKEFQTMNDPILVSGTDGVGTKLRVAFMADKHDTIGIDAVAMCVNDIIVSGAEPLFFLDYLAVGKLTPKSVADIVSGIAEGCKQAGCALIGGETAEMPGFYKDDEYDVAGFAVGIVDRERMIDGKDIKTGDVIIGLPSTGLHSNGFSLARKVLIKEGEDSLNRIPEGADKPLVEYLLEPTKIYVEDLLPLIKYEKNIIKGIAHITGGGLLENIPRILPDDLSAEIKLGTWPIPYIFELIAKEGPVEEKEMLRTFNMGIGMVLIVSPDDLDIVAASFTERNIDFYEIGKITPGQKDVKFSE